VDVSTRLQKKEEIARLLAAGLDHYADDAIGPAIQSWREVLQLDHTNAEALDYIQSADRRDQRRLPPDEQMSDTHRHLVHAATGLIDEGDWEGALDLLRSPGDEAPTVLDFEATVEIVRSQLLRRYGERVGSDASVPRLKNPSADITGFNLPTDAGFVLSLIDGSTPLADLVSLSGMDAFEAFRIFGSLLDADIVEMNA